MAAMDKAKIDGYLAPPDPPGPRKWLRENLFNDWFNSILTLLVASFTIYVIINVTTWATTSANWEPVIRFPTLFAVGQYPREELWRVGFSISFLAFLLGGTWRQFGNNIKGIALFIGGLFAVLGLLPFSHPELTANMRTFLVSVPLTIAVAYYLNGLKIFSRRLLLVLWVIFPILVIFVLRGVKGVDALDQVLTSAWGGLLVTFLLAVGGIVLSFPIGVALALGRRSKLPVLSGFSTIVIEGIRGVPLVTLLFMFSVILALFLPPEARLDRLVRALLAMTLFSAAYTAENIRGGLQAVPSGQIEAAKALGMNAFQVMLFIVLPQALRAVIPAIVGQFISLFKDTTLVVIVGINDLLGIGRSVVASEPEYIRAQLEVYLFIAAVYWIFSYFMSLASRRLETSLGIGQR